MVLKHPSITYKKGDIDRMKVLIEAKGESYYSTFLELLSCSLGIFIDEDKYAKSMLKY